jgi:hypothetical protein
MIDLVPITKRLLPGLILLIASATLADTSQVSDSTVPKNETPRGYGDGWNCDPGYRKANNAFEAISIPENAYATNKSCGSGWACVRGYRLEGAGCALIVVPDNAYLLVRPWMH